MNNIYCLNHNNKYKFVNMETLKTKNVTLEQIYDLKVNKNATSELINELDGGLYFERLKPEIYSAFSAQILLSYNCNYNCTYCYQKNKKYNKECIGPEQLEMINRFYDIYRKTFNSKAQLKGISIIGGEPFLPENEDTIRAALAIWRDKEFSFTTNGTLLELYKSYLENRKNVSLRVSIDGTKDMHHRNRISLNPNHYDDTIRNLEWAVLQNIDVTVMSVFNPDFLLEYSEFFNDMERIGWLKTPNLHLAFIPEMIGEGCDDIDLDYLKNSYHVIKQIKQSDWRMKYVDSRKMTPGNISFSHALNIAEKHGKYMPYRCGCLSTPSYTFSPDGKVYLCAAASNENGCIGSYFPDVKINIPLIENLHKRRIDMFTKCSSCKSKVFCLGGCAASALYRTGDISTPYCGIWKDSFILEHIDGS